MKKFAFINCKLIFGLGLLEMISPTFLVSLRADETASVANPYEAIVARNMFNLVPIPTNSPVEEVKPPDPPAKITPNGIMSLFGTAQVLFKVATPPKQGQPPQDQSYCLSEGDREDGIDVIQIDQTARVITFDNHGIIQKIPLVSDTGGSGGPGGPGGPGAGELRGRGMNGYASGGFAPSSLTSANNNGEANNGGNNSNPTSLPSGAGLISPEDVSRVRNSYMSDPNNLSPEAQVIMIEAQRQQLQAQGDPTANILPPTELTPQAQESAPGAPGPP